MPQVVRDLMRSPRAQARSVIMATIAGIHHLFVGLGDGHVVSFHMDVSAQSDVVLGGAKKVALGTQPIGLACFRNNGMVCVFVASDRPAVIYCSGGKLLYANVNINEVSVERLFSPSEGDILQDLLPSFWAFGGKLP